MSAREASRLRDLDIGGSPAAASEWRNGWGTALSGAFGQAFSAIPIYAIGVFIVPIQQDTGWTRAEITAGMILLSIITLLTAPIVGSVVDRYGPRRVGLIGAACHSVTIGLLGLCYVSIWAWWAGWLLVATTIAFTQLTIWTSAVARQFDRSRGLAIAITLCGTGLGSALAPLLAAPLISRLGWRLAFPALAAVGGAVTLTLLLTLFRDGHVARGSERLAPSATQASDVDGTEGIRHAILSNTFVRLVIVTFFGSMPMMALGVNFAPIVKAAGHSTAEAASLAGITGITAIAGRLVIGALLDRLAATWIGTAALLGLAAACILLMAEPASMMVLTTAAVAVGVATGAQAQIITYLTTRRFPLAQFGRLAALLSAVFAICGGVGPFLGSLIYDRTGGYGLLILLSSLSLTLAAGTLLSLGVRNGRDEGAHPSA